MMNERIKLLWEDAAKTTQGDSWEEQTKFMERFAELIVRECASVVKKEMDYDANWCDDKILKHFGVE
jgi:hypothetical protein